MGGGVGCFGWDEYGGWGWHLGYLNNLNNLNNLNPAHLNDLNCLNYLFLNQAREFK